MNNKLLKALIITLLLCMVSTTQAKMAHKEQQGKTMEACADPQQPASLRCAPAPSAQFDWQGRLWVV